jgi:hypothetical protein
MYLIRDVMHCKPGQVRPMVDKFKQLGKLMKKMGYVESMRISTDLSAERYWTVVSETEVDNLEKYGEMARQTMSDPKFQKIMKDYHSLIDDGRREIYKIEA